MILRIDARPENGFTLAELAIVSAIMGMIVLLCWPSVREMSKRLMAKAGSGREQMERNVSRERAAMADQITP